MLEHPNIIILTGASGSGKSTALAALEDAGFYCIDNMPILLVDHFLERYSADEDEYAGFALGIDMRDRHFLTHYDDMLKRLAAASYQVKIVYLDAEENVLLRRYNQTRRHHPLEETGNLMEAIQTEKSQMAPLKAIADHLVDTSHLSVHELKFTILGIAQQFDVFSSMTINILSFGYKYGAPQQADLMMDVRFIDNPYFVEKLKPKDGEADEVTDYVLNSEHTMPFLTRYLDLLDFVIPLYEKEGKAYLTIAIGCTGGRHRSVVIAKALYAHIRGSHLKVRLIHRDLQFDQ